MAAGPVGSVWETGSWSDTCWTENAWADAVEPVSTDQFPTWLMNLLLPLIGLVAGMLR